MVKYLTFSQQTAFDGNLIWKNACLPIFIEISIKIWFIMCFLLYVALLRNRQVQHSYITMVVFHSAYFVHCADVIS